ncbi:uncharacterized protein [Mytilus edulis]|uniref:uncharacterized protein n=1 Tax=Mytilus edulis TaxID=6550 RepID=UPI0039EFBDDD
MSTDKSLSVNFYQYLCQKVGSPEEVKVRRLTYITDDIGQADTTQITSGSKGEGLELKGSDLDSMILDTRFTVHESERDAVLQSIRSNKIPLVMNTEDTQPCFTHLLLHLDFLNDYKIKPEFKQMFEKSGPMIKFSNEQYKQCFILKMPLIKSEFGNLFKVHGPCISDAYELFDLAFCLKCDKWISHAQSWVSRPRSTWPAPELITKITSCGVLLVPIGCKGSLKENLQWRISFSVAEKILIFSFNHTQLLCYALLKILFKEIVNKDENMKDLVCSYFLKTLIFWISEESDSSKWTKDNIIPCFMSCLQRLMYCVEYSTLLHYFIPNNNMFYLRFNTENKEKMTNILQNLYKQGIHCFANSETLHEFTRLPCGINAPLTKQISIIETIRSRISRLQPLLLLNSLLHHCRTVLSKGIFTLFLSHAHQFEKQAAKIQRRPNNKHQYYKYKHDLSQLLIGTHSDAVSGWLMLASFYYVHKNYSAPLSIIDFVLRKFTDKQLFLYTPTCLIQNKESMINLMKEEKLHTVLKSITIKDLYFDVKSSFIPPELHMDNINQEIKIIPLQFAHFLAFLCNYHLHDNTSCMQSLRQISRTFIEQMKGKRNIESVLHSIICLGIGLQMMGDIINARGWFQIAANSDILQITRAEARLSSLSHYY